MDATSPEQIRERVRNSALAFLTRREHARAELAQKLSQRYSAPELIDETLDWLTDLGYLDDSRFTAMFVRSSVGSGRGPIRIAHELRQKGVANAQVEQALAECEVDWTELAADVLARKFSAAPVDAKEKARQIRFLQYRGFRPDHIFCQFER
ncbi:regulatory protein RecX [Gilvimarinus sp. DA14]|uniref:regulatory protein RecX n=1 Tax=Gilvimarinus sp. DA14 TaxID=2956798 RepID=UPI0020B874F6|nr:regulatory protein RecX [Gilvimarinus sp. DA14]UTF60151.1 recombination regulator RecX [Gilvimarinus sp. DA14]